MYSTHVIAAAEDCLKSVPQSIVIAIIVIGRAAADRARTSRRYVIGVSAVVIAAAAD